MTFEQVLVFHKIIQTGSFKAAADVLHKTQPAISLAIKKMEEEMQVELFDRSGYRPVLTDHGKALFERSLKVLQGMQELEALSQSFQNKEEPEIAVSIDGISPLPELLTIIKDFSAGHPLTKLNLSLDILSETERLVLAREAQIGLTHFLSENAPLETIPITCVRLLPVVSAEVHRTLGIRRQEDLLQLEQIVVGDKNGPRGMSFGLLDGGKKWRLTDSNFKREVILAGLGWGHLAEHTIERELAEGKLVILNFEDVHPRNLDIYLIRLKKNPLGPVARALWERLASLRSVK